MKKFFFFACALAVAATMNARDNRSNMNVDLNEKVAVMQDRFVETTRVADAPLLTDAQAAVDGVMKTVASFDDSQYYYTPGMMHAGVSPTGGLYYPVLNVPFQDSLVYYSYWVNEVQPAWYLTNSAHTQLETSSETYTAYYAIGDYYLPEVGAGIQKSVTGDTTYNFLPYSYGEAYAERAYLASGAYEGYKPAMTLCGMWADTIGGKSQDLYSIGAGSNGKYAYGTNLVINEYRLDTLAQLIRGVAPMKINALYLPIYGQSTDSIGSMLPNGAEIKVELFPIRNGRLFPAEPFATTYFSAEDFTPASGYKFTGVVKIVFTDEDELGIPTDVPVYTPDSFGVMFTGFNEQNCNFGIRADYYCPKANSTYYRQKGSWSTIWRGGGNNIALTFDAYWPFLNDTRYQSLDVPTVWEAPVEGGLAQFTDTLVQNSMYLFTNTDYESWEYVAEDEDGNEVDWIEVLTDTTGNYGRWDAVRIGFRAKALPEGTAFRSAVVGVAVDGIRYTRVVEQGEKMPEAVENQYKAEVATEKVIREGQVLIIKKEKAYNVVGQEVK